MVPPRNIPKPEIVWATDQSPFKEYADSLSFRNRWSYRSAVIRGDEQVVLHRVTIPNSDRFTPEDFDADEQVSFIRRHVPLKGHAYLVGLHSSDPISDEVQVPYFPYRREFHPAKQQPLAYNGLDLTWIKDIGKGGFGVASLWEASFDDGHKMKVVIKKPTKERDGIFAFADEREWHFRYRGAENITQSLDLAQLAKEHMTNPPKKRKNSQGEYRDRRTLVLEYMEHDSLGQLNHNLANIKYKSWPNGALWQLFASLVKGLAEMAYNNHIKKTQSVTFAQSFERMKTLSPQEQDLYWNELSQMPIAHDIHFDMEEYNILVGRDRRNGGITFKLHDFSNSHSFQMNDAWVEWDTSKYWRKRSPVKPGRHLPEQHTTEWDSIVYSLLRPDSYINFTGTDFNSMHQNKIAGRFGMWSNVFTIARTVECCVTGYQYTHPFRAKGGKINDVPQPTSYGWRLYDYGLLGNLNSNADDDLRRILAECMQEHPTSRPSLVRLLQVVYAAEQRGLLEDTNETCDFWWAATDPKGYQAYQAGLPAARFDPNKASAQPFSYEGQQAEGESKVAQSAEDTPERMFVSFSDADPYAPLQMLDHPQRRKRTGDRPLEEERARKAQKSWGHVQSEERLRPFHQRARRFLHDAKMENVPLESGELSWESVRAPAADQPHQHGSYLASRGSQPSVETAAAVERRRRAVGQAAQCQQGPNPTRGALLQRDPQVHWRDQTGLAEAMNRQMVLSNADNAGGKENDNKGKGNNRRGKKQRRGGKKNKNDQKSRQDSMVHVGHENSSSPKLTPDRW